ncbi:ankyrin-3 isoform X1 [Osmerus eperlanus]|uniref:ankyrin-3 isoform X1 n=1 Tax=Osmerus eperlanus TaxID=29151 RepID=UPI002E0D82BD
MNVVLTDSTLSLFLVFLFLFRYFTFKFMLNLLIQETTDRSSPRTQPTGYAYKPVFSTRSYQAWSAVPVAVPGQARSGFGSPTSSSSNTPSASPLKSVWSITSASPIKSNLGGSPAKSVSDIASPIRSYRTISSPIKTVVQQAQYPVQVNPTLLYSPGKSAPDPVSVKGLAALSARTSPITTGGGAALLERSSIAMTPPASPKSSLNMYNSTLPYKAVIVGSGAASNSSSSPIKTVPGLSSVRSGAEPSSPSRGLFSSLSSPIKSNPPPSAAALINGTVSPTKYRSSSPTSLLPSSLQERIQATTNAATTSVNAAFEEVEKTFNSCSAGYGTLKSLSSSASSSYQSMRSSASSSLYASLRSPPNSTTTVTSSTMTVPVYSVMNVLPEPQFKKLPEVSKSAAALLSPRKTALPEANVQAQSSFARTLSPVKSPLFMSPAALKSTTSSPLSSSQEILKDVAEMKEDLIRMSAILQTETNSASKGFQSDSPKEAKIEDEEPFRIVEKVKQDLVKVSEILTKDTVKDGKAALTKSALEEAQFSRVPADPPASNWSYPPRYETVVPQIKAKTLPDREFSLGKDLKLRSEEGRRDGEEKQKRVLKPAVAVQEHKLKMPPINMRSSASEKELCKLADVLFGPDVVLDSPDDILHDQDKSPLSDSGFETRSERTPSAPQSAEGMGPKALFQDIPPVITETRTEVVHVIRSYESPEDNKQPGIEDSRAVRYIDSEPKGHLNLNASTPDQNKCFQIKVSPEEDNMGKGMRVKEETHITTTTRMVYHKPPSKEAMSERCEETMSVHDIMKAFQSGRDPSRELAGLFEHKGGNEESSQRVLEDMNSKPKVERIIEVHIEKGNKTEPTEVIIRETSNHPEKEMYIYQGNGGGMRELTHRGDLDCSPRHEHEEPEESLPCYLESSRVHTPMSQEEDSRPSSAQLMADDSYKTLRLLSQQSVEYNDDESSELRGESYNFAEKMLLSEQLESSHSDTEEYLRDRSRFHSPDRSSHSECRSGGPRTEYVLRSSKNVSDKSGRMSNSDDNYDKLTLLQYSSEPGSPKQSVWMRVTDDRQAKNREKIIYEDRVDRTVKEAEEKLSEVSQFFRDKTEKLNDELSSPEKKSRRPDFRETRSGPSSTHSSPERSTYRNSGEDWSRDRFRDRFGTNDRKCASLPSSPERRVLLQYDDSDKSKQGDSTSQGSTGEAPKPFQMSSSKVSAVRLKFEQEAQKQDINPKWGQNSNPPVRKLQESKLPVYQVFAGSNLPQTPDSPGIQRRGLDSDSRGQTPSGNRYMSSSPKHTTNGKEQEEINILKTWESQGNGNYKSQPTKLSHILVPDTVKEGNGAESLREQCFKEGMSSKEETTQKIIYTELVVRESPSSSDGRNVSLKKNSESQIPVRIPSGFLENHQSTSLKLDPSVKLGDRAGSHIPTLARNRLHSGSEAIKSTNVSSIGKSADSLSSVVCNGVDSDQVEYLDQVTPVVVTEGFKDIKPLPVYVSIQVGKQYEKETATGQLGTYKKIVSHESRTVHETRGGFHSVKQQPASPHGSPEDDTLEQVTFMDSSGKSPVTPETPSSEEVSLASRTPDSVIGFMPGMPSPIPEESEEEDGKTFIYKESPQEKAKPVSSEPPNKKQEAGQRTKEKRVAYIEFPPPPPLEAEHSDPEKRGSCASSEAETEMMEVNLQEEHDRHLLAEPIIRVQPPSPVPPGADDSDSSDDESVFHPIPTKKYTFKMKEEGEKRLKAKKSEKNVTQKESAVNGVVKGEDVDFEQNGNDQSITDCSIATTAEFSHDTDATEIDSLDGYDLQDEDDGMSEQDPKSSSLSMDGKNTDRSFNQSKLEVIEEEKTPCEEGGGENAKSKSSENNENEERDYTLEGRHPERLTQTENYFGYQLEEELNSTFKTVATKGLDFDPWSTKGSEDGVYEAKAKDEDPKPFGLSVEDKSQATTPDTTPARTPTDESTPTSEPNPFPFHEGKMFEMTRSGAIDMSKRDFVEERLQFFQIGEHSSDGKSGDKGKLGQSPGVVATPQSKTGERAGEVTIDTTDSTPAKCSPAQTDTGTGCPDVLSGDPVAETTSSCTITASKVDPKLRTPIKMGIAVSITVKKDSGELPDGKAELTESHMPEYVSINSQLGENKTSRHADPKMSDTRDYPAENCNNNNNLESSSIQANYIQCGSVVFNLQSSSEPTLQKASRIETLFCRDSADRDSGSGQSEQRKAEASQEADVRQPKSRLPVKASGWSFHTQGTAIGKQKPRQVVKAEVRKRPEPAVAKVEPRSRIPIKDVKRSSASSSPISVQVTPQSARVGSGRVAIQLPSRLPLKDRPQVSVTGEMSGGRENPSEVCKRTIEYFKGISGETLKLADRLSDEEKKTEQSEEDSTSRSTSLSDASSQPSRSSRSGRGSRAEAGAGALRAKVDRASGSERSRRSRRTGGKEGSQGAAPRAPPVAEIKPSPQSPCERTDLRMAIVADHLGLSWTELAREMNFSVDEINHIRVENPNSLTAQSFMLLKKWVSRDGKNATTDALTAVLTKVNRMDIVTLLEGPIFDYGNISGTRSFADDSAVYRDQADDYHSILAELQSPVTLGSESTFMELHPDLPTPTPTPSPTIHHTPDEFLPDSAPLDLTKHQPWDDEMGLSVDLESPPRSPPRPCELALSFPVFDPTALSDAAMDVEGQVPLQHAEKITKVEVKLNHCQKSFPSTEEIEAEEEIALPTMPSLSPPSCEQGQEQETRTTESGNGGEKGELDREVGVSGGGEREKDREENSVREMEEVTEKDSGDAVEGGMLEGEEGCTVAPEVHKIEEVLDIVSEKWDMMEDSGEAKQDEQMGTSEGEKELEECAEKIEKRNSGLQEAEGLQERDRIAEDGGEAKLSLQSSGEDGGEAKLSLQSSGEDGGEAKLSLQSWAEAVEEDRESGSSEEEEDRDEMTEDKIKSLLEDVKLEGAEEEEEGEEMTEARVQEILRQVQQAEKQLCSNVPGWNSESSSVNVEPPTPGRSVSSDLLDRQENSQENSSDSVTSSSRAESGRTRHNGNHSEPSSQDTSLPAPQDSANGRAGLGKEEGTLVSENKVQQRVNLESGSDEEQIITTRVFRRRVILKGEQAMHVPGESMTEEQYTDDDGNLITRKVIRKVIRRAATPTPEDQGGEWGRRGHGEPWAAPSFQEEESEPGEGARSSRRKEDRRSGEKTLHS